MYVLIIFILLKTGQIDARTSVVSPPNARHVCNEALPLTVRLYATGKFHDGPAENLIADVRGRCEKVIPD
jgi:hypothetical protein